MKYRVRVWSASEVVDEFTEQDKRTATAVARSIAEQGHEVDAPDGVTEFYPAHSIAVVEIHACEGETA